MLRHLSLFLSAAGMFLSAFVFFHSPHNHSAGEAMLGFGCIILVLVLICHGKTRINLLEIYGGCPVWAVALSILLTIFAVYGQVTTNTAGIPLSSLPAFYSVLGCAAYSAP